MDQPVFILTNAVASYIGRRRSNNNRAAIVCHLLVTAMAIPVALVPACRPLFLLGRVLIKRSGATRGLMSAQPPKAA